MATDAQKQELIDKVTRLVSERFGGDYARAFDHYDSDKKDGRIDKAELETLLKDAGIGNWLTRGAWIAGIIAAMDADQDGTISAEELIVALRS